MQYPIPSAPADNTLAVFPFVDDADVRTAVADDGGVWFCAKDVAAVLGLNYSGHFIKGLPETWKGLVRHTTPGGVQELQFINEPGLYRLIFRSDKPAAIEFANWVCGEVLPEIRRKGSYGQVTPQDEIQLSKAVAALTQQLEKTKDEFSTRMLIDQIRRLCRTAHHAMPALECLGRDRRQMIFGDI
jgi:prophage antirepressor-like protein